MARLMLNYGCSLRSVPLVAYLSLRTIPTFPLRAVDRCVSWRKVRQTRVEKAPVFIIGHWRSGTTHLHNLMSCDPQFGVLTTLHCIASSSFLGMPGLIRTLVGRNRLPAKRPMDDVWQSIDATQEEEMAMARLSLLSWDLTWLFPKYMREIHDRSVLFQGEPGLAEEWKRTYDWLLRRLTVYHEGKRLCLKNPPNTARIAQLLELYPDARFIHIYRNPYVVYPSMMNMWTRLASLWGLQPYDPAEAEKNVVYYYQTVMQRYFEDCKLIPAGRLTEMRFEDLESDPLGELTRAYRELSLEGAETALPRMQEYLASLGTYRKNEYKFDEAAVKRVEDAWGFALEKWDYERPST